MAKLAAVMSDIRWPLKVIMGIMFEFAVNGESVKSHLYKCLGRNTSNAANSTCRIARDSLEYYQAYRHNRVLRVG
jgi:hypothetical protein